MNKEQIISSPTIPESVFHKLPKILKSPIDLLQTNREKDIFLIGALTTLGGTFTNVQGNYDKGTQHTNLFSFIIAPPANKKGTLMMPKALVMPIHKMLIEQSIQEQQTFKTIQKQSEEKKEKGLFDSTEKGSKPKFKTLFIPGNSSSAAVIGHLENNNGNGILFETEADTVSNTLKQDWGNFSDLFRKAFHSETITSSRKLNNEYLEVDRPKLSILLSGTPNQVPNLIQSAEDGLFSRFIFYVYTTPITWTDVTPRKNNQKLNTTIQQTGIELLNLYKKFKDIEFEFNFTQDQWEIFNKNYHKITSKIVNENKDDFISSIYRMGVITHRIAMILSVLRFFDAKEKIHLKNSKHQLICDNKDLKTAFEISLILIRHSFIVFNSLPKVASNKPEFGHNIVHQNLTKGDVLKRSEIVEKIAHLEIPDRTLSVYLKKLKEEGLLVQEKANGPYSVS